MNQPPGLDPYWMHDGPEGCQAAEAKLARVAALLPKWEDELRGMDGGYVDGLGGALNDLEDALKDPS